MPPPQEQSGPSPVTAWDSQVFTVLWQNLLADKLLVRHQPLTLLSLYWVGIIIAAVVPHVQVNATRTERTTGERRESAMREEERGETKASAPRSTALLQVVHE